LEKRWGFEMGRMRVTQKGLRLEKHSDSQRQMAIGMVRQMDFLMEKLKPKDFDWVRQKGFVKD
jgi:hypothetical protein